MRTTVASAAGRPAAPRPASRSRIRVVSCQRFMGRELPREGPAYAPALLDGNELRASRWRARTRSSSMLEGSSRLARLCSRDLPERRQTEQRAPDGLVSFRVERRHLELVGGQRIQLVRTISMSEDHAAPPAGAARGGKLHLRAPGRGGAV